MKKRSYQSISSGHADGAGNAEQSHRKQQAHLQTAPLAREPPGAWLHQQPLPHGRAGSIPQPASKTLTSSHLKENGGVVMPAHLLVQGPPAAAPAANRVQNVSGAWPPRPQGLGFGLSGNVGPSATTLSNPSKRHERVFRVPPASTSGLPLAPLGQELTFRSQPDQYPPAPPQPAAATQPKHPHEAPWQDPCQDPWHHQAPPSVMLHRIQPPPQPPAAAAPPSRQAHPYRPSPQAYEPHAPGAQQVPTSAPQAIHAAPSPGGGGTPADVTASSAAPTAAAATALPEPSATGAVAVAHPLVSRFQLLAPRPSAQHHIVAPQSSHGGSLPEVTMQPQRGGHGHTAGSYGACPTSDDSIARSGSAPAPAISALPGGDVTAGPSAGRHAPDCSGYAPEGASRHELLGITCEQPAGQLVPAVRQQQELQQPGQEPSGQPVRQHWKQQQSLRQAEMQHAPQRPLQGPSPPPPPQQHQHQNQQHQQQVPGAQLPPPVPRQQRPQLGLLEKQQNLIQRRNQQPEQQRQLPPLQQQQQQKQQEHHQLGVPGQALYRSLPTGPSELEPATGLNHPPTGFQGGLTSPPSASDAGSSMSDATTEPAPPASAALPNACVSNAGAVPGPTRATVMPPADKLKRPLRLALSDWIPHAGVVAAFEAKGVSKLYPWQAAALECGEDGHNLVYCAPTSGGKSLVAEVLMIRRLIAAALEHQRPKTRNSTAPPPPPALPRALLVLPYVSIVSEKAEHLTRVLAPLRGKVRGYSGAEQTSAPLSSPDELVAVVTMEKANSTVNRLLAEGRLGELCCVVVDEAHMVGDPHRGICLELCLTKLRFAAAAAKAAAAAAAPDGQARLAPKPASSVSSASTGPATAAGPAPFSCQLICMSATMSGLDDMCGWLGARLFMTNFRPVPLTEYAVFKGKVFRKLTQREMEQKAAIVAQQQQQQGPAYGDAGGGGPARETTKDAGAASATAADGNAPAAAASACCNSSNATFATAAGLAVAAAQAGGFTSAATAAAASVAASKAPAGGPGRAVTVEPLAEERDLQESSPKDPDRVVVLVAEVAREGHSTLVFCATRNACQGCAGMLADLLPKQLPPVSPETFRARRALLANLQDASGGYLSPELQKLIEAGVAYHHAGLTSQERATVEKGFRGGLIHTLTATSTLAAGINLPARRVILRSLWQGVGPVSRAQYLQMIGRAGRAGQSPIGEAFLIGKGAPYALQGEWRDVCRLMTSRLPPLRCCLLDSATAAEEGMSGGLAGGGAAAFLPGAASAAAAATTRNRSSTVTGAKEEDKVGAGGVGKRAAPNVVQRPEPRGCAKDAAGETHLQRMLLEAIANGSVTTGATVEALIRSTLMFQQAGYGEIAAATHSALSSLRQRRLVTFRPPSPKQATQPVGPAATAGARAAPSSRGLQTAAVAKDAPAPIGASLVATGALWQPTQIGKAIYDSCLPNAAGQVLYDRLTLSLDGLALEGGLHLVYLLLTEPLPVEVANWEAWAAMMERLPREPHLRLAEVLGVTAAYAQRLASGRRGSPEESARHCRFASACLMHEVLCEGDPHELEQTWGAPGGLTKHGISRGQLQKLQSDLSKWAGMAAVMAGSCGWWALQALLEGLSQQAAAGARPELLPLMALPNMTGARARGLYAAGITKPALLAAASEEDVKKALAASLPRTLRQAKPGSKGAKDKESAVAASAAASSGNALVARGARALMESARQYLADLAARVAREEAELEAAELRANGAAAGPVDEVGRAAARRVAVEAATRLAAELQAARGEAAPPIAVAGVGVAVGTGDVGRVRGPAVGTAMATVTAYRGSARITELSDASRPEALAAFLQAWRAQPCFALSVISSSPLELEPEQRLLQQLQLGKVVPSGASDGGGRAAAAAAAATAGSGCLGAADLDGSRPSAVDAAMTIPGPPTAALSRQDSLSKGVGGTGARRADGGGADIGSRRLRDQTCAAGGSSGALGRVEGLVIAWSHTEAFVLTFEHHRPPAQPRAGEGYGNGSDFDGHGVRGGGGGGGLKRKARTQLGRSQKHGGAAAPSAGAREGQDVEAGGEGVEEPSVDGAAAAQAPSVGATAADAGGGSALWRAACEVLGCRHSSKVCWHAEAQLAVLMAAGCEPAGQWDDPRVMAWLAQGTAGPQELILQDLQRSLLPSYAVRVPLQHRAVATTACRSALVSWALEAPLRAMLAAEGVAAHYRLVEAPLTVALARTRIHHLRAGQAAAQPAGRRPRGPAPAAAGPGKPLHPHLRENSASDDLSHAAAASGFAEGSTAGPTSAATAAVAGTHPAADGGGAEAPRAGGAAGVVVDVEACRAELARVQASGAACARLFSELLHRPVDLASQAAVDALCSREYLVRRPGGGAMPPELMLGAPVGRQPPRADAFFVRAPLPPPERARAEALARLLTRGSAVAAMAAALEALLLSSSAPASTAVDAARPQINGRTPTPPQQQQTGLADGQVRGSGADGSKDLDMDAAVEQRQEYKQQQPGHRTGSATGAAAAAANAVGAASNSRVGCDGSVSAAVDAARFALQRTGIDGRLACVYGGCDAAAAAAGDPIAAAREAADALVLVTELSSAPAPWPSLQQQYCSSRGDDLQHLQSLLPLPVLFLDATHAPPPASEAPHWLAQAGPGSLRPGLLLEVQGPGPCMALSFGSGAESGRSTGSRCSTAVVAVNDPLTRQPLRLALPATQVWCARSCCAAEQSEAAARAGQLLLMATPQALRCPAEELLQPPPGWAFVTVMFPYLHLAVAAHCSGDERLVEALYQPQPWAAVAEAWQESQAEQLHRLLPSRPAPGGVAAACGGGGGLCSPPVVEMAARQVLSRALLGGCSHKELAAALGLTAGGGGGKVAAAALVSSFLEAFPGVARHREELRAKAKRDGYVELPSGQRLRPATRQLTAGGVAAGAKLQRLLGRMQLGAAAAEVVRTAAALALQRSQTLLLHHQGTPSSPAPAASPPPRALSTTSPRPPLPESPTRLQPDAQQAPPRTAPTACGSSGVEVGASRGELSNRKETLPVGSVSLVWCGEARATLCVPQRALQASLGEIQAAASSGVMSHLGLRVPLHVSIYHGRSLDLLRCEQYIPGQPQDGER